MPRQKNHFSSFGFLATCRKSSSTTGVSDVLLSVRRGEGRNERSSRNEASSRGRASSSSPPGQEAESASWNETFFSLRLVGRPERSAGDLVSKTWALIVSALRGILINCARFESLDASCAASLGRLPCSTLRGTISSHEAFFRFCPGETGDERVRQTVRRGGAKRTSDLPRSTENEGAGEEGDSCDSGLSWS